MNSNPHQINLLDGVRLQGSASAEPLFEAMVVMLQTARRDVQRMADANLLARFRSRVRVPGTTIENIAHQRHKNYSADGKANTAYALARRIPRGCSLIVNISTTIDAIAEALLQHKERRVITNNFNVATVLCSNAYCEVMVADGARAGLRHSG